MASDWEGLAAREASTEATAMATREIESMPGWTETYDTFGAGGIRTRSSQAYRDNYDNIDWGKPEREAAFEASRKSFEELCDHLTRAIERMYSPPMPWWRRAWHFARNAWWRLTRKSTKPTEYCTVIVPRGLLK